MKTILQSLLIMVSLFFTAVLSHLIPGKIPVWSFWLLILLAAFFILIAIKLETTEK